MLSPAWTDTEGVALYSRMVDDVVLLLMNRFWGSHKSRKSLSDAAILDVIIIPTSCRILENDSPESKSCASSFLTLSTSVVTELVVVLVVQSAEDNCTLPASLAGLGR